MKKLNKLQLPVTILLASIILGGFYFAAQQSKQNSIERQQKLELQSRSELVKEQAKRESVRQTEEQTKTFREECLKGKEKFDKQFEDFISTCTGNEGNSADFCLKSDAGKIFSEGFDLSECIQAKQSQI